MNISAFSILLAFLSVFSEAHTERSAIPPEQQRNLGLGARLGLERLRVVTWPVTATARRLRVLKTEPGTSEIGRVSGYQVTAEKSLSSDQALHAASALLDPSSYEEVAVAKPEPPSPIGHGSGLLCGGFRPALALSFTDVAGDTVHALVGFSCYQVEFDLSRASEHRDLRPDPPDPSKAPHKGIVRLDLSKTGKAALLKLALDAFPDDELFKKIQKAPW